MVVVGPVWPEGEGGAGRGGRAHTGRARPRRCGRDTGPGERQADMGKDTCVGQQRRQARRGVRQRELGQWPEEDPPQLWESQMQPGMG